MAVLRDIGFAAPVRAELEKIVKDDNSDNEVAKAAAAVIVMIDRS